MAAVGCSCFWCSDTTSLRILAASGFGRMADMSRLCWASVIRVFACTDIGSRTQVSLKLSLEKHAASSHIQRISVEGWRCLYDDHGLGTVRPVKVF